MRRGRKARGLAHARQPSRRRSCSLVIPVHRAPCALARRNRALERARSGRRAGCARRRRRHRPGAPDAERGIGLRRLHAQPGRRPAAVDARPLRPHEDVGAVLRLAAGLVPERLGLPRRLRDLPRQRPRHRAPGVDPQGRRRHQALHPVGLQRRHLPAVRGRHRQPGLPRRLDRRGALHAGAGLQGPLHRRREHAVARRRRRRPQHQGDRPPHRPGDDRRGLAALHGRLHGAGPRGLPGQGDRPQRDLVLGRHARHPAPAARRRRDRPRARLQRHRAHQRHRPLVVPGVQPT